MKKAFTGLYAAVHKHKIRREKHIINKMVKFLGMNQEETIKRFCFESWKEEVHLYKGADMLY